MTVKDLKKRLENIDDDKMVIITDGKGWTNIESVIETEHKVNILQETDAVFQES